MVDTNFSNIVKWILLSPLILVCIGVAVCEINKAYWDHQVKMMCEKDGGVTVLEHVEISKSQYPNLKFTPNDDVILLPEEYAKLDTPFFSTFSMEVLHKGFPEIRKYESTIIRNNDKKILSNYIGYSRVGGDFPTGIIHPSSFSCSKIKGINTDIGKSTFTVKR